MRTSRDPATEERPKPKPKTLHTENTSAERPNKPQIRLETSREKDSGRLRSTASESRPLVKFKTASEVAKETVKHNEEKKSTSILDRIVKPSDQAKRPLPLSKERAQTEQEYDKVIKKVKPELTTE